MKLISRCLIAALLSLGVATVALADGLEFASVASGAQEVSPPAPPGGVVTPNSAQIEVTFSEDLSSADFRITTNDAAFASTVTGLHLHCGETGVNGPVVVGFFGPGPFGPFMGDELEGTITNAEITAAPACGAGGPVNNIASLRAAMEQGRIYLNVHTPFAPPGEVRGQLLSRD